MPPEQPDQSTLPLDPAASAVAATAPASVNGKGATAEGEGGESDVQARLAELDRLKRAYGQVVQEKAKEKAEREKLSAALREWNKIEEDHHVSQTELTEMLKQREAAAEQNARDKGEVDTLLNNQKAKYEREIQKLQDQLADIREKVVAAKDRTIEALTIDQELEAGLTAIRVKPSLMKGAFSLHRSKLKIIADPDAKHGVRVVAMVGDGEMAVTDFLKNWAENDPDSWDYLVGNQSTGGGAPPGQRPGVMGSWKKRSEMNPAEKSEAITKLGVERYNQLPW